jgi:hypothetical protein
MLSRPVLFSPSSTARRRALAGPGPPQPPAPRFRTPRPAAPPQTHRSCGRAAGFGPADLSLDPSEDGTLGASGGLTLLAHALVDIGGQLGARLEPFGLGPVSAQLGGCGLGGGGRGQPAGGGRLALRGPEAPAGVWAGWVKPLPASRTGRPCTPVCHLSRAAASLLQPTNRTISPLTDHPSAFPLLCPASPGDHHPTTARRRPRRPLLVWWRPSRLTLPCARCRARWRRRRQRPRAPLWRRWRRRAAGRVGAYR